MATRGTYSSGLGSTGSLSAGSPSAGSLSPHTPRQMRAETASGEGSSEASDMSHAEIRSSSSWSMSTHVFISVRAWWRCSGVSSPTLTTHAPSSPIVCLLSDGHRASSSASTRASERRYGITLPSRTPESLSLARRSMSFRGNSSESCEESCTAMAVQRWHRARSVTPRFVTPRHWTAASRTPNATHRETRRRKTMGENSSARARRLN
mmetsp:Transcript_10775/g.30039  ORF Transcript_10775/g.30039 Transcript_10775/m.30039 type:complete len:208 (+) Transcript_10775:520-1143(+)